MKGGEPMKKSNVQSVKAAVIRTFNVIAGKIAGDALLANELYYCANTF